MKGGGMTRLFPVVHGVSHLRGVRKYLRGDVRCLRAASSSAGVTVAPDNEVKTVTGGLAGRIWIT